MTKPLHEWGALELARAIAARELSVQALAEALIERSRSLDPSLRAWAWFDEARARAAARALDRQAPRGPLHGVPIGVKDIIDTAGIPTAYGSAIYRDHVPGVDAACVALARAGGAWVLGKTVSAELANMTPGPTRHPRDARHTPGGSSSGSAAAVAAGLVPLALGTQTAGSVIRPAAFCGVVGYKPSTGRIPRAGVKGNAESLDEVGIFARSVGDAALLSSCLAMPAEPAAQAFAPRVAWTLTSRADALSDDSADMLAATLRRLSAAGAQVSELAWPPGWDTLFDAHFTVQWFETARALEPEWLYRRTQLSPGLVRMLAQGRRIAGDDYRRAREAAATGRAALGDIFAAVDVILAPAAAGAAPRGLRSTGDPLFSRPWQLLGCPCIALPVRDDIRGLPLGVQLIGRPGGDARLLAAAAWVEAAIR
ncbi:amidase [Piscinibacter sp. XHJ-5]|uniref:amidase n=1 Tax=Piscinibacter sp. XHJ-5 TaxID=3037797 RepID=UPI0024533736|nr:amidase [Piscinibacter sp. XHJ-5]